jgi:hypothetical protein
MCEHRNILIGSVNEEGSLCCGIGCSSGTCFECLPLLVGLREITSRCGEWYVFLYFEVTYETLGTSHSFAKDVKR